MNGLTVNNFATCVVPICQLPEHVVMELSCETRKCIGAFGVWPVTRSTWRNLGLKDATPNTSAGLYKIDHLSIALEDRLRLMN